MATAQDLVTRVRSALIDNGDTGAALRWPDADIFRYISDGQRTIVAAIPRASSLVALVTLAAGTRQSIPADGHCLLSVNRNMGAGGTTPGAAIRLIDKFILDTQYVTWHSDPATAEARAYTFDMSDQTAFNVFPASLGATQIEINYSRVPVEITALTDPLTVKPIFLTALYDYVMYRAHQKDSDYAGGQAVAAGYLASFSAFLTSAHQDPMTIATQKGQT